jgi:hypothetical protein
MAAATDMAEHTIGHHELEQTIPEETRLQWNAEVIAWEKDKDQLNPYEITSEGMKSPLTYFFSETYIISRTYASFNTARISRTGSSGIGGWKRFLAG